MGTTKKISVRGSSPTVERSLQLTGLFSSVPRTIVATVSHQGHGQRSRGLGSEVGCVLAQEPRWFADSTPLFDRCTERIDRGTEILLVEPCAGRAESGVGLDVDNIKSCVLPDI